MWIRNKSFIFLSLVYFSQPSIPVAQTRQLPQTGMQAPAPPAPTKRERKRIPIIDPTTGKDINEEISQNSTPPASGSSSARATPAPVRAHYATGSIPWSRQIVWSNLFGHKLSHQVLQIAKTYHFYHSGTIHKLSWMATLLELRYEQWEEFWV